MSLQRKINNWLRQRDRIDSRVFKTTHPYLLSAPLYKSTVVKSQTKVPKNCSTIYFFCSRINNQSKGRIHQDLWIERRAMEHLNVSARKRNA